MDAEELLRRYAAGERNFAGIDLRRTVDSAGVLCNLKGANLRGINLRGADLCSTYLKGADLSGAYLLGAKLDCANLIDANLSEAILSGANLRDRHHHLRELGAVVL